MQKIKVRIKVLIKRLKQQLNFLSTKYRIAGMTAEDLRQDLILKIIEDYQYKKNRKEHLGWWFKRLQWHIYNMIRKSRIKPLNKTISIHTFDL